MTIKISPSWDWVPSKFQGKFQRPNLWFLTRAKFSWWLKTCLRSTLSKTYSLFIVIKETESPSKLYWKILKISINFLFLFKLEPEVKLEDFTPLIWRSVKTMEGQESPSFSEKKSTAIWPSLSQSSWTTSTATQTGTALDLALRTISVFLLIKISTKDPAIFAELSWMSLWSLRAIFWSPIWSFGPLAAIKLNYIINIWSCFWLNIRSFNSAKNRFYLFPGDCSGGFFEFGLWTARLSFGSFIVSFETRLSAPEECAGGCPLPSGIFGIQKLALWSSWVFILKGLFA